MSVFLRKKNYRFFRQMATVQHLSRAVLLQIDRKKISHFLVVKGIRCFNPKIVWQDQHFMELITLIAWRLNFHLPQIFKQVQTWIKDWDGSLNSLTAWPQWPLVVLIRMYLINLKDFHHTTIIIMDRGKDRNRDVLASILESE